ncbi:MAG: radical SAM protein [Promethearchaeia archaeon]
MATCKFCGKESSLVSKILQICRECIINADKNKVKEHLLNVHSKVRLSENLPVIPPKSKEKNIRFSCNLCINKCKVSEDDKSYCGLRDYQKNEQGNLSYPTKDKAYMHGYLDSNPTNCCNSWFCPAGTSRGYPEYSIYDGDETGTYSYAAFLYGCSFDCLFCQNSSHKHFTKDDLMEAEAVADRIFKNKNITCMCFFGGDPEPQLPFTVHLAELVLEKIDEAREENRKFRVCWEWNGSGRQDLMEQCMKIALKTGGNIKFDLKTYHEQLNIALCGTSNKRTLKNFKYLGENYFGTRNTLPELSGCTLLVPGYTNSKEIERIAKFIANINPEIPYSLLVFHPDYMMKDLPYTSKKQAYKCLEIAETYLEHVHLGNEFLLH